MDAINRSIKLVEQGKVEEATQLLDQVTESASDEEKFTIINLYYEWGFLEQAIQLLEELLQKYPKEGEIITLLAEINIELEKDDEAIELLNQLNKDDPFYAAALMQLADLYQAQGLFEVSEQKLLEAKDMYPEEIVIDFALGELMFSIGQPNRAIPFYERTLLKTKELNGVSIQERLAESYASVGRYEEALQFYEKLSSEHPDTLFKHGFTAFERGRNDIAIRIWSKLMEIDPYYYTVYEQLSKAYKAEGRLEEAYEVVQKGLQMNEFNKDLYFTAGQLAYQLLKVSESTEYIQQAIALDHDFSKAVLFLVTIYTDENEYNKIIHLINDVKAAGATNPLYDWELAKAYNEQEAYKEALQMYKEASTELSDDSDFLKEYGYFLVEEGLISDAKETLQQYMDLEPLDEEVAAFLERLNFSNHE